MNLCFGHWGFLHHLRVYLPRASDRGLHGVLRGDLWRLRPSLTPVVRRSTSLHSEKSHPGVCNCQTDLSLLKSSSPVSAHPFPTFSPWKTQKWSIFFDALEIYSFLKEHLDRQMLQLTRIFLSYLADKFGKHRRSWGGWHYPGLCKTQWWLFWHLEFFYYHFRRFQSLILWIEARDSFINSKNCMVCLPDACNPILLTPFFFRFHNLFSISKQTPFSIFYTPPFQWPPLYTNHPLVGGCRRGDAYDPPWSVFFGGCENWVVFGT